MKIPRLVLVLVALGAFLPSFSQTPGPAKPVEGAPTAADVAKAKVEAEAKAKLEAEREQRIAWFRQAKYGLFIHWGLYAIPAGEWKGRHSPGIGEWVMHRLQIPRQEYAELAPWFNPHKFDADAWVRMAIDAGMKYIVITSKHHDGFAMYHSKVSRYNIVDATPFKRDPIKELADACARHKMPFGFYYSQAQDWYEPGGAGNEWEFGPDAEKDKNGAYDKYIKEKAVPQVRELLQNYGPVCLMWFDTPRMMTAERGQVFIDAVRELQPKTLIDGRLMPGGGGGDYVSTGDNVIPNLKMEGDWEVPATINHTWGYRKDDTNWKAPGDIVFKLVDIASKGGNYLLNVGPTAEGVIPQASIDNLLTAGGWLKKNGDAIYGAGRSPFGDEFGDYAAKLKDREGKPVFLARNEWRCTTKPGKLFFTIFKIGRDGEFQLPTFKNAIKATYLLDDPKRTPLDLKTKPDGTRTITISRFAVNDTMGAVAVIEIEGDSVQP
jgi:alpha-L-fucosidase